MMKNILKIICTFFLLTTLVPSTEWGYSILPVAEVKPGMVGKGMTVFYGEEIEEFGVEVIDVMHNFYPKLDIVLVKLLGEQVEKNGIVSGMSGSPVYIDGKLVGALSYRFGQFMKEPIGGLMPIEYMLEIEKKNKDREITLSRQTPYLQNFIHAALVGADDTFWTTILNYPEPMESTHPQLNIISSPLMFSGFQSELVNHFISQFRGMGFTPMIAGGAGTGKPQKTSFQPGSAVSIVFLTGDLAIEASGTVTAVGENKLLSFGHHLFNFGPISLPLAGTQVYATLPSLMGSSKMATATGIVGTFLQDRLAGAFGDLSLQPNMIPVHFEMESPFHETRSFNFKLASDPAFNNMLPFYMRMALIQAAYSARLAGEQNSSRLRGAINLTDGRTLELNDLFTSQQTFGFLSSGADAVSAADLVTVLMGNIMINDFNGPDIASVDIRLATMPGKKYSKIESVWQDKTEVKPGESVRLSINIRDNKENIQKISRIIPIPKNISGRQLSIIVSSGSALSRYEVQVSRGKFVPKDFDHLFKILSERRKSQNLYIQLRERDSGLIVEGQEMLDLPPSVTEVMNSRASTGTISRVPDRVVYEQVVPMDDVIIGAKRLILSIESPSKATSSNGNDQKAWYQ
ncbi:hypothetical protein EH223_20720 [candidate division KSB1 bacterium]|nr:hypothetical protein [candidate division KSB1 bacterium]RQV99927.1 MAG: hypothetical protein EH223_20720 [candidate division KSB1 bacterium]